MIVMHGGVNDVRGDIPKGKITEDGKTNDRQKSIRRRKKW